MEAALCRAKYLAKDERVLDAHAGSGALMRAAGVGGVSGQADKTPGVGRRRMLIHAKDSPT